MSLKKNNLRALKIAALLLAAGCGNEAAGPGQGQPGAPPEVAVVTVRTEAAPLSATLPGRTAAWRVAEVRPQVTGIVQERLFEEGAAVVAGQPLYRIDQAPYQAALDSAKAALEKAAAVATAAKNREARYARLVKIKGVSQQDYDDAAAASRQARADVALARAALAAAQVDFDRTVIKAPIDGRIGRTLVTDGALVNANQATALAVINALDPIYVDVMQSSAELLDLKRKLANGELSTIDDGELEVNLTLEDGSPYERAGRLALQEVSVEPKTGAVTLRAVFPNPDQLLLPGMFVRAEIIEGVRERAIFIPQQALNRNAFGDGVVFVVNADHAVEQRTVKTERAEGDRWLIASGLEPGEQVIVEGFQRVRPGAVVTPVAAEPQKNEDVASASGSTGLD